MTWHDIDVTQSCPILCDPMDCSLPGSSVHGIFQARVLEWVAISFARRSSRPRDRSQVSLIVGRHFTIWATRKVQSLVIACSKYSQKCYYFILSRYIYLLLILLKNRLKSHCIANSHIVCRFVMAILNRYQFS